MENRGDITGEGDATSREHARRSDRTRAYVCTFGDEDAREKEYARKRKRRELEGIGKEKGKVEDESGSG